MRVGRHPLDAQCRPPPPTPRCGVAYRAALFDLDRLLDYDGWPGGAFFVDDDWIAAALDDAGVRRVVLGGASAAAPAARALASADLLVEAPS